MPASSLLALIDDIASVLDDVTLMSKVAAKKTAGVLGDDLALNAQQVSGVHSERELPVVWSVAKGSLKNKAILVPAALLISAFAPWAVTPLLMLGGAYLCFEATEKIIEAVVEHEDTDEIEELALSSKELEKQKVVGAIRTDLILSAEIMAIALNDVTGQPLSVQAGALAIVGLAITIGVYGVVALIVKMDDIGLHLSERRAASTQALGRGMVKAMPVVLDWLTRIGTAAMLWVGGGIIVHGLEHFHLTPIPHWVEAVSHWAAGVPAIGPVTGWLAFAIGSALVGLVVGGVIVGALRLIPGSKH